MSHIKTNPVVVKLLDCLKRATKKFPKLRWMEGQKTYSWYGTWQQDYNAQDAAFRQGLDPAEYGKCEHAIRVHGSQYEIGVVKRKDGQGYSLVWDFWGPGKKIDKVIGAGGEKLLVEYQKEYLQQFASESGFTFSMNEETAEVKIEMEVFS